MIYDGFVGYLILLVGVVVCYVVSLWCFDFA